MKKRMIAILVFCLVLPGLFAMGVFDQGMQGGTQDIPGIQNAGEQGSQLSVSQMDNTVRALAEDIHRKLILVRAEKIIVGQFGFQGTFPALGAYWNNQLSGEFANMSNRTYTVLSGGLSGADWTISGEIVDLTGVIRVYTRLVRTEDRAIEAAFQSDFERSSALIGMLASGGGGDSRGGSLLIPDEWEPDSWDNPVSYDIGDDENAALMNRNLHDDEDEDFFLLVPDSDGRLVMETTGSTDTYMEFYDADTREMLADDDDGGSGSNARIRYNVQAGRRYIAKVRGYGGTTGNYGFRAYLQAQLSLGPDEYEPDDDHDQAKWIEIEKPQQHTFHSGDDVDWVKFQITQAGRYTIRARGLESNDLDTYIELFDEDLDSIGEDDDGGEGYSSRLSRRLSTGLYYLKVRCLDDDPEQPYIISIEAE